MNIPDFKPKREFLDGIELPCLFATVKNSELPKVATRYIAKYKKDPVCHIWVRSSNPKELTDWPKEILEQLLEKEGLPSALEEGMKEFETSDEWAGYFKDGRNYGDIKEHGIVPHLTVESIVIDEIRHEVILVSETEWDGNLSEHGIAIHLRDGRWRFDYEDHLSDYIGEVEDEGRESRWEVVRPPGAVSPETDTDNSFIFGIWEFDEKESRALLERLKVSPRAAREIIDNCGRTQYQISPTHFVDIVGPQTIQRWEYVLIGCERRGEQVTIKFRRPKHDKVITKNLYYHSGLLMNLEGMVLRRKAKD